MCPNVSIGALIGMILFMSVLTLSGEGSVENPQPGSDPALNSLYCIMDPHDVSSLALSLHSCTPFSSYHTNMAWLLSWGPFVIVLCFTPSFVFFLYFFSSVFTLYIPHISASHGPLIPLPLLTFLGEWVESSMGMWDPRRAGGLLLTGAQWVC